MIPRIIILLVGLPNIAYIHECPMPPSNDHRILNSHLLALVFFLINVFSCIWIIIIFIVWCRTIIYQCLVNSWLVSLDAFGFAVVVFGFLQLLLMFDCSHYFTEASLTEITNFKILIFFVIKRVAQVNDLLLYSIYLLLGRLVINIFFVRFAR